MEGIREVYSMLYDSKERGYNRLGNYLGKFRIIKQIRDDAYVDDFIGQNIENEEICLILSREVCGKGGGIAYEVIPLPELVVKNEVIK